APSTAYALSVRGRPTGAAARCRSSSTACTPTTWARSSTTTAWPSAWDTTVRGPCTGASGSPRPRAHRWPSTTPPTRSTRSSPPCSMHASSSGRRERGTHARRERGDDAGGGALDDAPPDTTRGGGPMRLEQMYQEVILDHYKNPHGRGLREPYEAEVHHVNPTCGDELTLRVHLEPGAGGEAPTV